MKLSSEFRNFTTRFFQDLNDEFETRVKMYAFFLAPFKEEKGERLREDLEVILLADMTDEDLKKFWWASDADIVFTDGAHVRAMLEGARDRL